jgi:hypothetical protein
LRGGTLRTVRTHLAAYLSACQLGITLASLGLVGVGRSEAFQLLWNSAGIFYGLTYLAMFAVPLLGLKRSQMPVPWWVKACAASGFLMTALYVGLSVLPIIPVGSRTVFAMKIVGLIVVTNVVGVGLYIAGKKRSGRQS